MASEDLMYKVFYIKINQKPFYIVKQPLTPIKYYYTLLTFFK